MAKVKAVKFHSDFCENGAIKYPAGTVLKKNDESMRCVALNFAEEESIDEKLITDPIAEQAEADRFAAEQTAAKQAEADRLAAEKADAIAKLNEEITHLETELANATEEENPGILSRLGALITGSSRAAIQTALDAKRAEVVSLQQPV